MLWNRQRARALRETIRAHRVERGLSQEALAHNAGVTKNQVQLIEAGRNTTSELGPESNPTLRTLYGLADALKMSPRDLLPDEHDG